MRINNLTNLVQKEIYQINLRNLVLIYNKTQDYLILKENRLNKTKKE